MIRVVAVTANWKITRLCVVKEPTPCAGFDCGRVLQPGEHYTQHVIDVGCKCKRAFCSDCYHYKIVEIEDGELYTLYRESNIAHDHDRIDRMGDRP